MAETIRELREQLQGEKVRPVGWKRPFGYVTLQRGPSIYITRLLLSTNITANQVTLFNLLLGIVSAGLLFCNSWELKLVGVIFLYLHTVLDRTDGEIARYRKTYSLKGIYIDEIIHLIVPPLFFLAFAFGLPPHSPLSSLTLCIAGSIAAIALIIIRVTNSLPQQIYAKKYIKQPELFTLPEKNDSEDTQPAKNEIIRAPIHIFHLSQEFFLVLIVFFITLVFERIFLPDYIFYPITSWVLVGFSVAFAVIAIENILKGWFATESTVRDLAQK